MAQPRVAIIGAGASGICAAKALLRRGAEVQVFESSHQFGGTWDYGGPASVVYSSLRTNLPKGAVGFACI